MSNVDVVIVGQGLAGSCVAWSLHWTGHRVMLIDRGESITASKIAAGLITPVTGRRLSLAHRYAENYRQAVDFYRRIERELDCSLLDEKPAIRQFLNDEERETFEQKLSACDGQFTPLNDDAGRVIGFEMRDAARIRVSRFLDQTREYFRSRGQYLQAGLNLDTDIVITDGGASVACLDIRSSVVVFCQGYQQTANRWFPTVPDGPAKGEILRVKLSGVQEDTVVHKGVWLVPDTLADGEVSFLVGATYDRDRLNSTPTASGREELLNGLKQITARPAEVISHVAAVRAGMKRRRPVAGRHPDNARLFILNGLGSHGSLLAPVAARALSDLICGTPINGDLHEVIDFLPTKPDTLPMTNTNGRSRSLTQLAHNVIRRIVQPGNTVIDATAGNGNDTCFLAALVGVAGRTIAIDIQQSAIDATSERLAKAGLSADLRLADHATELDCLKSSGLSAGAVMFNLGYLPGSDKQFTTTGTSTIAAIQFACELLSPGGVLTIIAYRGHTGGLEEAALVEQLIARLPIERFESSRIEGDPGNTTSPVLFILRKTAHGAMSAT